jgi:Flp pilus assembly protein TadD
LTQAAAVKQAAAKDYWEGLYFIRKNSTVDRAIPLLERAVIADPDSPLTYAALAEGERREYVITQDQKWIARSSESLLQAQLRNPDLAPVHSVAGLHKFFDGWYEQAEQEFRRAIELDPANGDNYRWLGNTLESNNQLGDAAAAYSKAIEFAPRDYQNPSAMGGYYYNQGNYSEAAKYFRHAMDLEPKEPSTHFALGQVYANLGQSKDAENEFRTSLNLGETPRALDSLGALLMDEGRDPEAIFYIKNALDKWPARYLWWTNLGTAYRRTKQPMASQRAYQRGLDLAKAEMIRNPREGRVRAVLAYLYARVDKRDVAESQVAEALRESPSDADARFWAVLTYEALNDRNSSIKVLSSSSAAVLADVARDPDLADLRQDSRFQELLAAHQQK